MSETIERGRWSLVYEPNQDGDPDYPPWTLMDVGRDQTWTTTLADCTEADLRDLAAVTTTACGAVVVDEARLRQFGIDCWRRGDDSVGETNADEDVDALLARLTAAPAGTEQPDGSAGAEEAALTGRMAALLRNDVRPWVAETQTRLRLGPETLVLRIDALLAEYDGKEQDGGR